MLIHATSPDGTVFDEYEGLFIQTDKICAVYINIATNSVIADIGTKRFTIAKVEQHDNNYTDEETKFRLRLYLAMYLYYTAKMKNYPSNERLCLNEKQAKLFIEHEVKSSIYGSMELDEFCKKGVEMQPVRTESDLNEWLNWFAASYANVHLS